MFQGLNTHTKSLQGNPELRQVVGQIPISVTPLKQIESSLQIYLCNRPRLESVAACYRLVGTGVPENPTYGRSYKM